MGRAVRRRKRALQMCNPNPGTSSFLNTWWGNKVDNSHGESQDFAVFFPLATYTARTPILGDRWKSPKLHLRTILHKEVQCKVNHGVGILEVRITERD